jgi:hypothetical protein
MEQKTQELLQWSLDFAQMLNYAALKNAFHTVQLLCSDYLPGDKYDTLTEIRNTVLNIIRPTNQELIDTFLKEEAGKSVIEDEDANEDQNENDNNS